MRIFWNETKFIHYINFLKLKGIGTTEKIIAQKRISDMVDKGCIELERTYACHDPFFNA